MRKVGDRHRRLGRVVGLGFVALSLQTPVFGQDAAVDAGALPEAGLAIDASSDAGVAVDSGAEHDGSTAFDAATAASDAGDASAELDGALFEDASGEGPDFGEECDYLPDCECDLDPDLCLPDGPEDDFIEGEGDDDEVPLPVVPADGGTQPFVLPPDEFDDGCSCTLAEPRSSQLGGFVAMIAVLLLRWRRAAASRLDGRA
jgi:MYXO-CTERM domain-containing protein